MAEVHSLKEKIEVAKRVIREEVERHPKIAVACSFGKDSMVVVHLSRQVSPTIPIFSVMTPYKPKESFTYIQQMDELLQLGVVVHFAGQEAPEALRFLGERLKLYPDLDKRAKGYASELNQNLRKMFGNSQEFPLYEIAPSLCCDLYKTDVTKRAVRHLNAWICGLRKDEGRTRIDYRYVEDKGDGLVKVNPIIDFSEAEVLTYLKQANIPLHPWYAIESEDGRRYRSLGCAPCTVPILPFQKEREGRWIGTSKCGGECGIHTQALKEKGFTDGKGI